LAVRESVFEGEFQPPQTQKGRTDHSARALCDRGAHSASTARNAASSGGSRVRQSRRRSGARV
jgi:hypothetical protein